MSVEAKSWLPPVPPGNRALRLRAGQQQETNRRDSSGHARSLNVFCLWSFCGGYYVERHFFPRLECFKARTLYRFVMNEYVVPFLLSDEAETFLVVPPFYFAAGHSFSLLNSRPGQK